MSLENAIQIALNAVRDASLVCQKVQSALGGEDTLTKDDKSPVTVADFASQAMIVANLLQYDSSIPIIGEEESSELSQPENASLLEGVTTLVQSVNADTSKEDVLRWMDAGKPDSTPSRFWTLDPIDGTKGFVAGRQYAIALALVENGKVQIGVLGCPNMTGPGDANGMLFLAAEGQSPVQISLQDLTQSTPIRVSDIADPTLGTVCESVEAAHSNHSASAQIVTSLGIQNPPFRIDSQCKYAAVARGDASIYLRLPTRKGYQEKIWDHAAGVAVVEAAGGTVTDVDGKPLDFTCGHLLKNNRGVVATGGTIHARVLEAVQKVI